MDARERKGESVTAAIETARARPRIALVDWTQSIEDFLDTLNLSLDEFCTELTGGWMFGYVDALKRAGVVTTLYCFTRSHAQALARVHVPTGATIRVLPVPSAYRRLRRRVLNPYAATVEEAVGDVRGIDRLWCQALLAAAPYLATPVRALAQSLRAERCAAILCQEYESPRFDLIAVLARRLGVPLFATFQGGDTRAHWLERRVRPWTLRTAAGVIVASRVERERLAALQAVPPGRVHAVFNPVDQALFPAVTQQAARTALALPHTARIVAWHGRLNWHRKGLDVLFESWARLCAARPEGPELLLLMGTGGDADRVRAAVDALPAARVRWIDRYVNDRSEISRFLHAADVYAFPSRHEGLPVAPIEALQCGLPVVGARAPGIEDILGDGPDAPGLLVPQEDVSAFLGALTDLLDHDARRAALAQSARERVAAAFESDAVGAQLARILLAPLREQHT